jgi:hypothetical protein
MQSILQLSQLVWHLAIVLTGCVSTSPGIPNVFLINLRDTNAGASLTSQIRIGYFGKNSLLLDLKGMANRSRGLYIGEPGDFVCTSTSGMTAAALVSKFSNMSSSPLATDGTKGQALISLALTLQGKIFPPLLAASGSTFLIGLLSLTLLKRDIRRFPQSVAERTPFDALKRMERIRSFTVLSIWASVGLVLTSCVAVAQTAGGLKFTTAAENSSTSSTNITGRYHLVHLKSLRTSPYIYLSELGNPSYL